MNKALKQQNIIAYLVLINSFQLAAFAVDEAKQESTSKQSKKTVAMEKKKDSNTNKLADGFYHVVKEAQSRREVEPIAAKGERLIVYDFHLFDTDERQPTKYVVLEPEHYVPLILGEAPNREKDDKGKPNLLLKLAENQIKPLEDFTTKHLGGTVAIVIGGDIVTMHKIKSAISGGRVQITRCSDHGCQVIYTELQKERQK